MKHQQVSVDYWVMGKAFLSYGLLTVMGWIMIRLFSTVFNLPRRMRAQQNRIQNTLEELQRRFPDLNITEEDLQNAEQELEALIKEEDEKKANAVSELSGEKENEVMEEKGDSEATGDNSIEKTGQIEDKKTI